MSVFSLQATVLKNIFSQNLVDKKEMLTHQINLFHFASGCVKLEVCLSSLSLSALCYYHLNFAIMYALDFLRCVQ